MKKFRTVQPGLVAQSSSLSGPRPGLKNAHSTVQFGLLSQAAKAKATALSKIGSTSLRHARSSLCPVLALGRACRPVYQ